MRKSLEEMLIEYAANKQTFRRARNKSKFLDLWPEIQAMLGKGWSMQAISKVAKINGLLDLHYESLRRYVIQQRAMEKPSDEPPTPERDSEIVKLISGKKPKPGSNGESEQNVDEKPPYSTPPQFGRFSREDDEKLF